MKRILFLLPSLGSGGAERQATTIAILLKKKGYEVEFLVYFAGDFHEKYLLDAGVKVNRHICNGVKRLFYVTRFIQKGRYDVVISFSPTPNFLNCFSAMFRKKWRVVISERSSKRNSMKTRQGRIYGCFYHLADDFVSNSNNARQMWLDVYPQYCDKLKTIYNTVTLGEVNTEYIPRKGGYVNFIIAASIYKTKNPMGLLNAILLMNENERHSIHIDWYGRSEATIGDHDEYDKVVKTIEEKQLSDVIALHDATDDIANRMNESDCVALFSVLEGLPNAICEGMMLGKPIVMSRCSDYNVLVEVGVNGFLCDWNDAESIKKALLKVAELSNEKIQEMGNESRKKAEFLFSQEKVLNQWLSVIENKQV